MGSNGGCARITGTSTHSLPKFSLKSCRLNQDMNFIFADTFFGRSAK